MTITENRRHVARRGRARGRTRSSLTPSRLAAFVPCFGLLEVLVDEGDGHAAFADGRSDAFYGRGADVAAREDAGNARLEEVRVAVEFPASGGGRVGACEYVAVAIDGDLRRQPRGLGIRPDEDEQSAG